ncbi:hypothetical protein KAR91_80330 [Candidatus Pacearchaeota archaeon]|nr:hypothetical protein [Candidatus Pacearchaeota archaeon]
MASIQKYLDSKLDDHCRDHVINEMGIAEDDPEYKEEFESFKGLLEISLWRDWQIIETAYYMKVPKKALYRFGYTNEDIHEEMESIFADPTYPY